MSGRRLRGALLLGAAVALGVAAVAPPAAALQCGAGTFEFYDGGGIKACEIEADHQMWTKRGVRIVCRGGYRLSQHANGAVASCTLAETQTFDGTECPAGKVVALNPDGALEECG